MTKPLESSLARIYSKSGEVIGAGFLVTAKHILTCAHVVADALEIERETVEIPDAEITLDFPMLAPQRLFKARVVFWRPVDPTELEEDIAGLELESLPPNGFRCVRLVTSDDLWGHPFQVLGFPAGQPNGVPASGVLRTRNAKGWVQLEDVKQTGYALQHGFSGAPVWDDELQGVAGMAVTAEIDQPEVKGAFIIPATQLAKAWPKLNQQVIYPEIWRPVYTQAKHHVEAGSITINQQEIPRNHYNYGFIVDSVNYKELSDATRVYSLNVFNKGYADGVIESRSQHGELIEIRGIEGVRIPAKVWEFGVQSIERLWRLSTEGYDFLDPRNSLGNSHKTEVRNITVPPGGILKLTKIGENALVYNQATFLSGLFFKSPGFSGLLALCEKIQKKHIGSFVKSEIFRDLMRENLSVPLDEATKIFVASSWVDNQKLEALKEICEVMRQENINASNFLGNTLGNMLRITGLEMLNFPLNVTEDFVKRSNGFLQWLDWERAQIVEGTQGALFIEYLPRSN
ncbi:S1 family peptidase [Microseira wollei]|uniref:Peptidase S1 and S6, chymotrypsin/Hap n=1 Tax=Microseira wollei NIES-4236 TaxID=2530354 RepID=A0AAV3XLV3_9CYAN|nr:serine protease [Microseira wollei]GET43308.1 peptidase S1 and S6, chymotrypsin/Hap [Microseira wollei NIES-4236]